MQGQGKTTQDSTAGGRIRAAAAAVRKANLEIALRLGGAYLTQACSGAEIVCALYMGMADLGPSFGSRNAQPVGSNPDTAADPQLRGSLYNGVPADGGASPGRDRLFISACHYATTVYAALVEAGRLDAGALEHVGEDGYNLDVVAAEHSPGYETVSGSLGQTVSIAAGVAHAYKLKGWPGRVFCLLTDGELNEGQDWECFQLAAKMGLDNLIVVVDVNHQQGEGWTYDILPLDPLGARFESFGWDRVWIDGHDPDQLLRAPGVEHAGKPLAILCETDPAHGIPALKELVPDHFVDVCDGNRSLLEAALADLDARSGSTVGGGA